MAGWRSPNDGEDEGEFPAVEEMKLDHVRWEDFLTNPAGPGPT
jgi:hypothetical protein